LGKSFLVSVAADVQFGYNILPAIDPELKARIEAFLTERRSKRAASSLSEGIDIKMNVD